jgi:uncharacterized lipoprotein YehR (DUF1307 family)
VPIIACCGVVTLQNVVPILGCYKHPPLKKQSSVYKGKFNEFTMKKDEDVSTMFNRLNDIVNELKFLDFDVTNKDFLTSSLDAFQKNMRQL